MSFTDTEDIFKARGVIVGMREAEASSPVKQVTGPAKMLSKESVQSLIDNVAALLVFNCFSPRMTTTYLMRTMMARCNFLI
jgi:hypothetical protein